MKSVLLSLLILLPMVALAAPPAVTNLKSTFECVGLTWPWTDDLATATTSSVCTIEYRTPAGSGSWLPGLDLWADGDNSRFAGSVVHLNPGTEYEFRLTCDSPSVQTTFTASTWSETFGEGTVNTFGTKTGLFNVTSASNGTSNAYTVWENGTMTTANPGLATQMVLGSNCQYMIFRNIVFTGGQENCVEIGSGSKDIIFENCTFQGWGEPGRADSGIFPDGRSNSAITSDATGGLERIIIQNCEITCDTSGSNDWEDFWGNSNDTVDDMAFSAVADGGAGKIIVTVVDASDVPVEKIKVSITGSTSYDNTDYDDEYAITATTATTITLLSPTIGFSGTETGTLDFPGTSHPRGPRAIQFIQSIGNHVIRYNKMVGTGQDTMFCDVLGGGENNSATEGAYGNDSDVYGNEVGWCLDNGLELEGANRNTRVWFNYLYRHRNAIGAAAVRQGPFYMWRNAITRCKALRTEDVTGTTMVKTGSGPGDESRRIYALFNTLEDDGNAHDGAISNSGGGTSKLWFIRNNIWQVQDISVFLQKPDPPSDPGHSIEYDLSSHTPDSGKIVGAYAVQSYIGSPTYASAFGFDSSVIGPLDVASLGYRGGEAIPNFGMNATTRATISDPDVGAMDARMVPFVFGIQMPAVGGGSATVTGTLTIGP